MSAMNNKSLPQSFFATMARLGYAGAIADLSLLTRRYP